MNKVSIKYLEELRVCEKSLVWFKKHFGIKEYTIEELLDLIKEKNIIPDYVYVRWIIVLCEFAQTQQMMEYYTSLNPDYRDVRWFIVNCKFARTQTMIDYYLSLNTGY